jgi:hypothetical protein
MVKDLSTSSYYKVTGYKPVVGNQVDYFKANSESAVYSYIKSVGPEEGGFVTYSVEEIEVLPPELSISCPNCDHQFVSPDRVRSLG